MVVHPLLVGLDDLRLAWLGDDGEGGSTRRDVLRDGHPAEEAEYVLVRLRGVLDERLLHNLRIYNQAFICLLKLAINFLIIVSF